MLLLIFPSNSRTRVPVLSSPALCGIYAELRVNRNWLSHGCALDEGCYEHPAKAGLGLLTETLNRKCYSRERTAHKLPGSAGRTKTPSCSRVNAQAAARKGQRWAKPTRDAKFRSGRLRKTATGGTDVSSSRASLCFAGASSP